MKVAVLMSTWQGERYIEEQLHSILRQLPANGELIVRDDGSTDTGVERILAVGDPRVTVLRGDNIGFARSFLALLDAAPDDADIVMFSDQDDVWLPGKIDRAVARLAPLADRPGLYFTRLQLVDEALHPIGISPAWRRPPSFENALVENIAFGCTCALNRAGVVLARERGDVGLLQFHDWWLYLLISAFGQVLADPEPSMLYRQHAANTVGARGGWRHYARGLRTFARGRWVHAMFGQIENLRRVHGKRLSPQQQLLLDRFFDARRPASITRLLLVPRRFRQRLVDDVLLRLMLLATLLLRRGLLPPQALAPSPAPAAAVRDGPSSC